MEPARQHASPSQLRADSIDLGFAPKRSAAPSTHGLQICSLPLTGL